MKIIPIKDLKENLAEWASLAARGEEITVTKYNRPYITLGPSGMLGLQVGSRVGRGTLTSVCRRGSRGKWLKILADDRADVS